MRWVLAAAAVLLAGTAACGPRPQPAPAAAPRPRSHATAPAAPSARSTLGAYLDATFAGRHAKAWSLLTARDQAEVTRSAYVREQEANDRVRSQVQALGAMRRRIAQLRERGDRAEAVVVLSSGLGSQRMRFVLRREHGSWRIDYQDSWTDAE